MNQTTTTKQGQGQSAQAQGQGQRPAMRQPQQLSRQQVEHQAQKWLGESGRKGGAVTRDMFDNTLAGFLGAVLGAIAGAQLAIQKKHSSTPAEIDLSREAAMLDGPMQALSAFQAQLNADPDTAAIPAPQVPNTDPAAAGADPASGG
jgi:hypothetical protein